MKYDILMIVEIALALAVEPALILVLPRRDRNREFEKIVDISLGVQREKLSRSR
jgi:hypothetical protein